MLQAAGARKVSLSAVAKKYETGIPTVFRWYRDGIKGLDGVRVYLGAQKVGGRLFTSWEDVEEFMQAINRRPTDEVQTPRSPAERGRASERAGRDLERAGI